MRYIFIPITKQSSIPLYALVPTILLSCEWAFLRVHVENAQHLYFTACLSLQVSPCISPQMTIKHSLLPLNSIPHIDFISWLLWIAVFRRGVQVTLTYNGVLSLGHLPNGPSIDFFKGLCKVGEDLISWSLNVACVLTSTDDELQAA